MNEESFLDYIVEKYELDRDYETEGFMERLNAVVIKYDLRVVN